MYRPQSGEFISHLKKVNEGEPLDLRSKSFPSHLSSLTKLRHLNKASDLVDPHKATVVHDFSSGYVSKVERFFIRANSAKILKELLTVVRDMGRSELPQVSDARLLAVVVVQKLAVSLQLEGKRGKAEKILELVQKKIRPQKELAALMFAYRAMAAISSSRYDLATNLFRKSTQSLAGLKGAEIDTSCLDRIYSFLQRDAVEQLSGRPLLTGHWEQRDRFYELVKDLKCELSKKYENLSKLNGRSVGGQDWAHRAALLRINCGTPHDFDACLDNLRNFKDISSFQVRLLDVARCQYEGDYHTAGEMLHDCYEDVQSRFESLAPIDQGALSLTADTIATFLSLYSKQEGYFRNIELRIGEDINVINHEGKDIRERLKYQTLIAQLYSNFPQALDAENLNIAFESIEKKNVLFARQYLHASKAFIEGHNAWTREHAILISRYNLFRAHTQHDTVHVLLKLAATISNDSEPEAVMDVLEQIYTQEEIKKLTADSCVREWEIDAMLLYERLRSEIERRWFDADRHYQAFFSGVEGIIQKYWLDISDHEVDWVRADWNKLKSDWAAGKVIKRQDYPINALQLRVVFGTGNVVSVTPEPINSTDTALFD